MTTTSNTREFPNTQALNFRNTLEQNPYEWKFPGRTETMYLSTINAPDVGFNAYNVERRSRTLFTQDIVPTKTRIIKCESKSLKNDDIERSQCRKLAEPLNKPYYNLRNDDVEGSKPFVTKFVTNRKATNPLAPEYVLPSYEAIEPLEQKFIRDSICIDDIRGARPKKLHKLHKTERRTNYIEDISGSRAKKEYCRKEILNPLDCKDINEFRIFKTNRVTNPLMPIYDVQDDDNQPIKIGQIQGSKSRIRHPENVNKETSLSLKINDIDGCKTSTVGNSHIRNRVHGNYTNTNLTKDIPGAQISTLKKGIQTKRHLNPLVPQYVYLDREGGISAPAVNNKAATPPRDSAAVNDVVATTTSPPADKGEIRPTDPRRASDVVSPKEA